MTPKNQLANDLYCLSSAGFCIIPDFIPPETVSPLHEKAEAWVEEVRAHERATGEPIGYGSSWPLENIRCLYAVDEAFQELALDSRIHEYAASYLGAYKIGDVQVISNLPDGLNSHGGSGGPVSFHRDHGWRDDHDPPYALHCFMPLTDMTRENGATVIVPGSHRMPEPCDAFADSEQAESTDGNSYTVYRRRIFPSSISLEAPSGSLVLIDPTAIHSQGINVNEEKRTVLNVAFRQPILKGLLNCHGIATRHSRVNESPDFLNHLVHDESLPGTYGPLKPKFPPDSLADAL
jgi:hypothetical protein